MAVSHLRPATISTRHTESTDSPSPLPRMYSLTDFSLSKGVATATKTSSPLPPPRHPLKYEQCSNSQPDLNTEHLDITYYTNGTNIFSRVEIPSTMGKPSTMGRKANGYHSLRVPSWAQGPDQGILANSVRGIKPYGSEYGNV